MSTLKKIFHYGSVFLKLFKNEMTSAKTKVGRPTTLQKQAHTSSKLLSCMCLYYTNLELSIHLMRQFVLVEVIKGNISSLAP